MKQREVRISIATPVGDFGKSSSVHLFDEFKTRSFIHNKKIPRLIVGRDFCFGGFITP
ncbi:hypothetical protein BH11PAT3_BH11PAT3_0810 [soil metagenome]